MRLSIVYRSTRDYGQLTIKLRHYKKGVTEKEIVLHYKTPIYANKKFPKIIPITDKHRLEKCIAYVTDHFNAKDEDFIPNKKWFHKRCNAFFDKKPVVKPLLVDWVEEYLRVKRAGEISDRRKKNLKLLKTVINEYDTYLEMTDLTAKELEKLKLWFRETKEYAISTSNNFIADIKTICKYASGKTEFSQDWRNWEKYSLTPKAKQEQTMVITLTLDEINRIEQLELKSERLINTRKWLIIGVNTAMRGSELLSLTKQSFVNENGNLMINFIQEKTGKIMKIPALKRVKQLYETEELPYSIAMQNLNIYLKELGKLAKIDTIIDWKLKERVIVDGKEVSRHIKKPRPKYEYIASHIFRRTFCTYYYEMQVAPKEIMKISGHSSVGMLMKYIKETRPDFKNWKQYM